MLLSPFLFYSGILLNLYLSIRITGPLSASYEKYFSGILSGLQIPIKYKQFANRHDRPTA
jgi:hypothetical protein